jgi:putative aldouronate transport system permease protein
MFSMRSTSEKIFNIFNYFILTALCIVCLYPLWHVLMASISDPIIIFGRRGFILWPLGKVALKGYKLVLNNPNIMTGFFNSVFYVVAGTSLSMVLTITGAYVLSRKGVYWNKYLTKIIIFTMYFHGGLIPFYLMVMNMGLKDSRMAIILPTAINTFNLIVMRTAFAGVSTSMWESAKIDGAHELRIIWQIMVPLAQATVAVVALFYAVWMWNSWFNPSLFLDSKEKFPLQLLLREILLENSGSNSMTQLGQGTVGQSSMESYRLLVRYCTIIVATVPILVAYPFLQRYFITGVMIGGVKG